jgi:mannose-6-phosphate isomerase-like protein (cupin superfamily)
MQEKIEQVAARIRDLRKIRGLEVEVVARELKLPAEEYRQFESGAADIPVSVLLQLAQRLGVELADLLTGEEPRLHTYTVTRSGRGVSVDRRREYRYQSLAHNFVHKKAEPFLVTVEPRPDDVEAHFNSHPGQEFNYVLEGTLRVVLDKHEVILQAGDSLFFDSGVPHGMRALEGRPVRLLAVIL